MTKTFLKYLKKNWLFVALIGLIVALFIVQICRYNFDKQRIFADQSTHYMQTDSIIHDFDLRYEKTDLERFYAQPFGEERGPVGLFLKKNDDGEFFYAKPFLFPLFATPFVAVFGFKGVFVFNSLLLFAVFGVILRDLSKKNNKYLALAMVFSLVVFTYIPTYIFNFHPDIFISSLIFFAIYFLYKYLDESNNKYLIFGSIIYGMALYEKFPFLIFLPIIAAIFIYNKKYKSVFVLIALMLVTLAIPASVNYSQDGNINAYSGQRTVHHRDYPFDDDKTLAESLDSGKIVGTGRFFSPEFIFSKLKSNPEKYFKNVVYHFTGRQTGLFIYAFPFVFLMIVGLCCNKKYWYRILPLFLVYIIFYSIILDQNYYGGADSFGDRYLLQILFLSGIGVTILPKKLYLNVFIILLSIGVAFAFLDFNNWSDPANSPIVLRKKMIRKFPYTLIPIEETLVSTIFGGSDIVMSTCGQDSAPPKILRLSEYSKQKDNYYEIFGYRYADFMVVTEEEINEIEMTFDSGEFDNTVIISPENESIELKKNKPIKYVIKLNKYSSDLVYEFNNCEKTRYFYYVSFKAGEITKDNRSIKIYFPENFLRIDI